MTDQKIYDEITELNRSIDLAEDTDYLHLDEAKELRHRVMYVHARLEASIGIALWGWIIKPINETVPIETRQEMGRKFETIINDMDFARKLTLAQKQGLFSKETVSLLHDVNMLRVKYSHPKAHHDELKKLENPQAQLEALRTLKQAFDKMDEEFASVIASRK